MHKRVQILNIIPFGSIYRHFFIIGTNITTCNRIVEFIKDENAQHVFSSISKRLRVFLLSERVHEQDYYKRQTSSFLTL